jgi:hypothetical protein
MLARIRVENGSTTSWPIAERVARGWQSGVMFYPDETVAEVVRLYVQTEPAYTVSEIKAMAEDNTDSQGNLYRLDFYDRLDHEDELDRKDN